MKKLLLLLMASLPLVATAQKIKNHYVVREEADASILYMMPVTLFEADGYGELTYDITWRDGVGEDSLPATLNFTYYAPDPLEADSLEIRGREVSLAAPCRKLYIDPENRRWKHRYTLSFPVEELFVLYQESSPEVVLHTPKGEVRFEVKRRAWGEYQPIGQRIVETIRLNRR